MDTPRGFKNISTTYQLVYLTTDGNVQVRKIGARLWEILVRGGVTARGGASIYETSKEAALTLARKLASRPKRNVRRAKRKVRR